MTGRESSLIEKLRDELHGYHVEVVKLAEGCKPCQKAIAKLNLDIYGVEGETDTHPGLMGHVDSLRRSRQLMRLAMRGAWVLLTLLIGGGLTAFWRAMF